MKHDKTEILVFSDDNQQDNENKLFKTEVLELTNLIPTNKIVIKKKDDNPKDSNNKKDKNNNNQKKDEKKTKQKEKKQNDLKDKEEDNVVEQNNTNINDKNNNIEQNNINNNDKNNNIEQNNINNNDENNNTEQNSINNNDENNNTEQNSININENNNNTDQNSININENNNNTEQNNTNINEENNKDNQNNTNDNVENNDIELENNVSNKKKHNAIIIFEILLFSLLIIYSSYLTIFYINNIQKKKMLEKKEIDEQDSYNLNIENNEASLNIPYDNTPEYLKGYVDCLNKGLDKKEFSSDLNKLINQLNNNVKQYNNRLQIAYTDINTGFHLSYNEKHKNYAASSTKGIVANYVYMLADENKIDLSKQYTYTSKYYANGTGVLKNRETNTKYSLRTLTEYTIVNSDNIAYRMLLDIVNQKDVANYFKEKGALNTFDSNSDILYGDLTPYDGNIYMIELYKYSLTNTDNSKELINYFRKSGMNNVKIATNKDVAHKYGWTNKYANDLALVYDDNPYVIAITSTLGNQNWSIIFQDVAKNVDSIHNEYWKELKNYCKNNL